MQFYLEKHNFLDVDVRQVQTYLVKLPFYDVTTTYNYSFEFTKH